MLTTCNGMMLALNLSHQIDHYVQQPTPHVSQILTGVGPPLAQSVGQPSTGPRYPHLPTSSNALFGPRCTQTPLPSFPAPQTIQPDFLATQPLVPTVPNNDPVMTASQAVTAAGAVVIPVQAATAPNDPTNPAVTLCPAASTIRKFCSIN